MKRRKNTSWPGMLTLFLACLTLIMTIVGITLVSTTGSTTWATSHYRSEGVEAHGADIFLAQEHDGSLPSNNRVKVGIIDGSFINFSTRPDTELPTTLSGQVKFNCFYQDSSDNWQNLGSFDKCETKTEHGTNVAEIIIDMAPEVELYITNPPNDEQLKKAVDWLVEKNVDIVNMSQTYGVKGDGGGDSTVEYDVLDLVETIVGEPGGTPTGRLWVASAGNEARYNWYGPYINNFGSAEYLEFANRESFQEVEVEKDETLHVRMRWDDDWGGAPNASEGASCDLNIAVFRNRTKVAESSMMQRGMAGHNPYEQIAHEEKVASADYLIGMKIGEHGCTNHPSWIQMMVTDPHPDDDFFEYGNQYGPFYPTSIGDWYQTGVPAESSSDALLSVGASGADLTTLHESSNRGPTIDGRKKPDLVAAACVQTSLNYSTHIDSTKRTFCGTSASAPHVTGMAALLKSKNPSWNGPQIANYLRENVIDRGQNGIDNLWGEGAAILPAALLKESGGTDPPESLSQGDQKVYKLKTPLEGNSAVRVQINSSHMAIGTCTTPRVTTTDLADDDDITITACSGTTGGLALIRLFKGQSIDMDDLLHTYQVTVEGSVPPPRPIGVINRQTVNINHPTVIDVSGNFDGASWYTALTDNPSIATIRLASPIATITGVSPGTTTLRIRGHNASGYVEQSFGVTVQEVDPVFNPASYRKSVPENEALQTSLLTVTATDPNSDPIEYSIYSGNNSGKFDIGQSSGTITLEAALDRSVQLTYSLVVRATDTMGNYDSATVTITVTEPLLPSAPAPGNIHQDSSTPTQIEVDWDQVDHTTMYQLEYKVATSNSWRTASSSITTSSYTLRNLTCGTDYHVRVTAYGDGITYDEDWGATSAETRLATSICPNPVFINEPYAFEIRETATIGTLVGTVQANDPNGDTVTYHVVPASPGDFAVNSATGNITVNAALDYDSRSSYRITVEARDPTGYTDTTTVSITVLENIPPAPSNLRATSTSKTAAEIAWDPLPNTTSYWLQYRLAGHTNWITASNAISGNTQQVPNLVCEATYQFQVRAFGDGLTYSDRWGVITQPLTVVMPDCGEPVFGSTSYTFQVTQGSTVGTEVGILDASDPDGETITFSVTADQSGGRFVVDQHTGMITVNIVPTSIRNYAMTLQASDGAYSSSVPVEIQVVANRSPVIDSLTYDFSVRDDAALGTSVGYVSATDPENDPITYSFFAGHIEEDFNINAGTGEITVADPLNAVAIDEYVFLVQAFDGTSNAFTSVAVDVIDSAPCDGGTAVPDPGNNVALVADCQIMRGLQDDLAGDGTLNWSGRLAMTSWDGVTIAGTPSRVTEINLGSRSLQGVVPAGLGSLSALEVLDLNFNLLTGEIPAELGNLSSLTRLSLHVNALSGEMPTELGNLANLQELDLNFNYLNGPIPTQLGQLTELTLLNLSTNRLTGPVPTELGSLTNLVTLWLYDNRLTGSVPASLTALTSLQALHIADNRFTGCLPAALRSITFNDLAQLNLPDC